MTQSSAISFKIKRKVKLNHLIFKSNQIESRMFQIERFKIQIESQVA